MLFRIEPKLTFTRNRPEPNPSTGIHKIMDRTELKQYRFFPFSNSTEQTKLLVILR